jgi:hypothetical protein
MYHLKRIPYVKEINIVFNNVDYSRISSNETFGDIRIKYIFSPNHYNFSELRNQSLKMATKEWILVLDIDEFLSYEFIEELPSLLAQDCDFIKARRIDFWNKDSYREDLKHQKYYLFKNNTNTFFVRSLHEVLCVKHGKEMEDINPVHIVEDKVKIIYAQSPVYHYSFIKRQNEGTDKIALYKTIRYLSDFNQEGLNEFSREDLATHIKTESEKGKVLKEFEGKHPEELEGIL